MRNIWLVFLLLSVCICYASDPTAERPTYFAGDYWIFNKDGKDIKIEFLREEKDQYVFTKNGTNFVTDFNLTSLEKKAHGEYPGPIIQFPLKVGKWWNYEYEKEKELVEKLSGKRGLRIAKYEVIAYEQITVPAGTFWTFKIDVTKETFGKAKFKGSATYWYAPDIKQIIKSSEKGEAVSELKDYKIK